MERIAGILFSAALVRLAGAGLAVWLALTIGGALSETLGHISATLAAVNGQ